MTLADSNRYVKAIYPMTIIAAGMMALGWTSNTPAHSSRHLLHTSFKSKRPKTILSTGSSCKPDLFTSITSTQVECRMDDGDSYGLISRRAP